LLTLFIGDIKRNQVFPYNPSVPVPVDTAGVIRRAGNPARVHNWVMVCADSAAKAAKTTSSVGTTSAISSCTGDPSAVIDAAHSASLVVVLARTSVVNAGPYHSTR
jgi:hypothetical protein